MKVLVILGSPRRQGNTETLAKTVLETAGERFLENIEYINIHGLENLSGCIGCGGCEKDGMCVIKDDMIDLYSKVDEADVLLLVTPVYFYGPSAQIKTFIDRFQARWSRKYILKQPHRPDDRRFGYLLSTSATKGAKVFDANILIAKSFFDTADIPYSGELLVREVDERGALAKNEEEMERARKFGREIAAKIPAS